jgi:hypothetical protein
MTERIWMELEHKGRQWRVVQYFGGHYEGQVKNEKYGWMMQVSGHSMNNVKERILNS